MCDVVERDGVRLTSVARTVVDLAREHGIDAGIAAADAALHTHIATPSELQCALDGCAGWPGRAAAARATALSDGLAESALESVSRLRIVTAGLPTPLLQAEIGNRLGQFVARVDFYWPEYGVVGEADGNLKYDARPALVAERRREAALRDLGLVVVRWEWTDLYRFEAVVRRLQVAFDSGIGRGAGQRWSVLRPLHPPWSLSVER